MMLGAATRKAERREEWRGLVARSSLVVEPVQIPNVMYKYIGQLCYVVGRKQFQIENGQIC